MTRPPQRRGRAALIWAGLCAAIVLPLAAATFSPLLAWRDPIYIIAGFAGVIGLALLLVQPLLAGRYLPGFQGPKVLRIHRITGGILVLAIVVHVAALWITSPPDVVDALLFVSPTPFSVWGVIAMWAIFLTALLAAMRRRLRLSPQSWRIGHMALGIVIVGGTVVHAMLIDGTMEVLSKTALCALVIWATVKVAAQQLARIRR